MDVEAALELKEEFAGMGVRIDAGTVLHRRAVIVVGSHRSGTSALTRVFSLVGCDLPKHVMPPLVGNNEFGFWEPEAVVQAHDAFLAKIGSSWDEVTPLPDGAFVSAAALELRQQLALLVQDEYGTSPLFVVKDPRVSRLLPLWFAVLGQLQVAPATAIAVRNPLEVAASLKARDGFTTTKSLLLWLRHTLESERYSRGRPRSIVMYDELLRDWRGMLARVGDDLEITWPGVSRRATVEIENFLSDQQRHHVFDWSDIEGRADVASWVKEAYFALRASDPTPVLDQIRNELAQADTAFGPVLEEARLALEASEEQRLVVAATRDALAAELEARQLVLDTRAAEVQELQDDVAQLTSAIGASASRVAECEAEMETLRAERNDLAHQAETTVAEARRLAAAVEAAEARVAAASAEAAGAREELNAARVEVGRLRTVADEASSRAVALEASASAERVKVLTDLEVARVDIERLGRQVAVANAAFGTLEADATAERAGLLRQLEEARVDVKELTAQLSATKSEAAADHAKTLSELERAEARANRLEAQLGERSREAEELGLAADELLSIADAELEASRAERRRLQAEIVDALEEQGQLLVLVEHLEAAVAKAEAARSEVERGLGDLENVKAEAEHERAALIAERDSARTEAARLVAELEVVRARADRLATGTGELEATLQAQQALLHVLRSMTKRRSLRRRSLSQLGTWLLPPTPRKLNYLRRYVLLRWFGEFDIDSYLLSNPDVLVAGINPLMHYIEYGREEGRGTGENVGRPNGTVGTDTSSLDAALQQAEQFPSPTVEIPSADADDRGDERIVRASGLFDERFYLEQNMDVRDAGVDPVFHYLIRGHAEGRDPSAHFRTTYYRVKYLGGDLLINPLVHYSTIGCQAGHHTAPGPHDNADSVHAEIRASVRPGDHFEEPDPQIAARSRPEVKALAFYLPQFHPIAENDEWWGRGFTDWRNVARGTPRFAGHYQPRIPRDLGFYDLMRPDVMPCQIELALQAGLSGFVFYYYWFDGKRLLEQPLERWLLDQSLDFPFCLMWANENWTRRWDGHEDDLLIQQTYDPERDVELVDDLQRYFADRRYVRIQGRPLLLLYRVDLIPHPHRTVERWRRIWESRHGESPLILGAQAFGNNEDPRLHGLDGAFEFPPHKLLEDCETINAELKITDPSFQGQVVSYATAAEASLSLPHPQFPLVKTAIPSWDNDPRREGQGLVVHGSTPALYERWLRGLVDIAVAHPVHGERLVFINAWNEWAEGAYLEPDVHYGAAYLNATARALCAAHTQNAAGKILIVGHDAFRFGAQKLAWHIGSLFRGQFGYEVAYMLLEGGDMVAEYERIGRVRIIRDDPSAIAGYLGQLRDNGYTVALTNTAATSAAIPELKEAGFRVVSLVHELGGIIDEYHLEDVIHKGLEKSDQVIVAADLVAEELARRGLSVRDRILIRPQGLYQQVDAAESARADVRRELGIPQDARVVLNVGSGDLRKGVDTFVHVAKLAAQVAPDLHFVWVGALHEQTARWLRMDLDERLADHLHFVPYTEVIGPFFAAADAFFLSSREDPYPSVILEAMKAGLPIVGFAGVSGIEHLVAEHGTVVDRSDPQGLVRALKYAVTEDDARARDARKRAIERDFRFDDYCFDLAKMLEPGLVKISVVVPNFNYAEFLGNRLESVFTQNYPVFEFILLDDGSTDRSLEVIDEMLARTGRVITVVASDTNSGSVFGQWERGVRLARGDYVWIAEADDLSKPDFLRRLGACASRIENLAFAFCDSIPIDVQGTALDESYKPYYRDVVGDLMDRDFAIDGKTFIRKCLSERNLVLNASSVLWSRKCLLDVLRDGACEVKKYRLAGDWYLYAAAAASGMKVAYVAEPLNLHRRHARAVTASLDGEAHVSEVERVHAFVARAVGADRQMRERMNAYADLLRAEFGLSQTNVGSTSVEALGRSELTDVPHSSNGKLL